MMTSDLEAIREPLHCIPVSDRDTGVKVGMAIAAGMTLSETAGPHAFLSALASKGRSGMNGGAVMRAKKLTGSGIIHAAAAHNLRAIQAERGTSGSIDPNRSHLNQALIGPSDPNAVAQRARALMKAAGVGKLRKDAVRAVEWLFSLSQSHSLNEVAFFTDAVNWVAQHFGGAENILCANIHRDEAAPHCHVLVLPLIGGRMTGSDAVGGPARLREPHSDFHKQIGKRYGLIRPPKSLHGNAKKAGIEAVLKSLQERADPALRSVVWSVIREFVERDPGPFMGLLGIDTPRYKFNRTMTQIFTSKGKGSNDPEVDQPYRVQAA